MPATAIGSYATAVLLKARVDIAVSDTGSDTELGKVCDQVNGYIEFRTRRPICPVGSATILLDGDGSRRFRYPRGILAISALSVAPRTGEAKVSLATTDYFLRPASHERIPGFPADEVWLSDVSWTVPCFGRGFDTISMTATTGFAAIPDEITDLALTAAVRAWHSTQAGQADIVGTDEMGRPLVSRFFSPRDLETLRGYSLDVPG